jgi:acyl-coenzyme A synthetase/AMP-(fatty) acid ligase
MSEPQAIAGTQDVRQGTIAAPSGNDAAVTVREVLRGRLDQEELLLFPALADALRWAGAWLVARGVNASDVMATYAPDSIEFIALCQTTSRLGGILVRLSPLFPRRGTHDQLGRARTYWLVTTSQLFVRKPAAPPWRPELAQSRLLGGGASTTGRRQG